MGMTPHPPMHPLHRARERTDGDPRQDEDPPDTPTHLKGVAVWEANWEGGLRKERWRARVRRAHGETLLCAD